MSRILIELGSMKVQHPLDAPILTDIDSMIDGAGSFFLLFRNMEHQPLRSERDFNDSTRDEQNVEKKKQIQ